jgi:hypothetical protein
MARIRRDRRDRPRRSYRKGKAGRPVLAKGGSRRGARGRQHHGLTAAKRLLARFGLRALDARTLVGRALAQWQREVVEDLGGAETISTGQRTLVELAARSKLLLDSIDVYILSLPSPVDRRRRVLYPCVLERQRLVGSLLATLEKPWTRAARFPGP